MDTKDIIVIFVAPMLTTIPVAALFCRHRLSGKKKVSYGTMVASACVVTLLWLVFVSEGRCFRSEFWSMEPAWKGSVGWGLTWTLRLLGFIASICALSALGVVAYYQKQSTRGETHVV